MRLDRFEVALACAVGSLLFREYAWLSGALVGIAVVLLLIPAKAPDRTSLIVELAPGQTRDGWTVLRRTYRGSPDEPDTLVVELVRRPNP